MGSTDDHNVPAIVQLQDGRMLVAYAGHAVTNTVWYRISASIDSDDWQEEASLTTSGNATYMPLVKQPNNDKIWMLYRTGTAAAGAWVIRHANIEGPNLKWSPEQPLLGSTYLIARLSEDGLFLLCVSYDHPIQGSDHAIYYTVIDLTDGNIYGRDNRTIGNIFFYKHKPVLKEDQLVAYKPENGNTVRIYELNQSGPLAISISDEIRLLEPRNADVRNSSYARLLFKSMSEAFVREQLFDSGPAFLGNPSGYFGSCGFHSSNSDIMFCARNLGEQVGVKDSELLRAVRNIDGSWSVGEVIRKVKGGMITRVQVRAGYLFWSEVRSYPSFNEWKASLHGLSIDQKWANPLPRLPVIFTERKTKDSSLNNVSFPTSMDVRRGSQTKVIGTDR